MAAKTVIFEKRDTLATCVIFARLLARREVGQFARRLIQVAIAPVARVAFGVGADVRPRECRGCVIVRWII